MKTNIFLSVAVMAAIIVPFTASPAYALSCLPIDMYLKDVVGKEEIVIFTGTVTDQIESDSYTAEVVEVSEGLQGYVEKELFVYHPKDATWGYLCNDGPAGEGVEGLFVAEPSEHGKYTVHQRLELTDPLVAALKADLEDAEIEGGVMELSRTDRMNQIMTTIHDLIKEIQTLMKEFLYWRNS